MTHQSHGVSETPRKEGDRLSRDERALPKAHIPFPEPTSSGSQSLISKFSSKGSDVWPLRAPILTWIYTQRWPHIHTIENKVILLDVQLGKKHTPLILAKTLANFKLLQQDTHHHHHLPKKENKGESTWVRLPQCEFCRLHSSSAF